MIFDIGELRVVVNVSIYKPLSYKHRTFIANKGTVQQRNRHIIRLHWCPDNSKTTTANSVQLNYCKYSNALETSSFICDMT